MKLSSLDKVAQHRTGHIGLRLVRHGGGEISSRSPAQAAIVLQTQRSERSKMQRQRKKARE
jgi:hypothetical protein